MENNKYETQYYIDFKLNDFDNKQILSVKDISLKIGDENPVIILNKYDVSAKQIKDIEEKYRSINEQIIQLEAQNRSYCQQIKDEENNYQQVLREYRGKLNSLFTDEKEFLEIIKNVSQLENKEKEYQAYLIAKDSLNKQIHELQLELKGIEVIDVEVVKEKLIILKQKLDSAQWFIDAIKQRQQTMLNTMQVIIDLQRDFFLTGDESNLKPMILKDVAERTGYDISTISRVSNSKYVQTNFGIFPLKYFFSESMQNESGEEVSSREIKKILQQCIENEDKRKPLADDKLCDLLKEKGYVIARRTVAKYREQLGIPVARLRKEI